MPFAAGQHGLVTRAQLRLHGISTDAIDRRLRANRLRALHRGVYQVGPLVAPRARELAAVLACGPHSFLSHRSAGALWQLLPDSAEATAVDVSIRRGDRGHRPNIRVHRVSLGANDVTVLDGIPVTSPSRTLVDLAAVLGRRELERALAQAERLNLLERGTLSALTAARGGRPGAPLLRSLLEDETRSLFVRDRIRRIMGRPMIPH